MQGELKMQAIVFRLTGLISLSKMKSKWQPCLENGESSDEIVVATNEIDCDDNFISSGDNAREQEHKETKLNKVNR